MLPKLCQLHCIFSGISEIAQQLGFMCFLVGFNITPFFKKLESERKMNNRLINNKRLIAKAAPRGDYPHIPYSL